MNVLFQLLIAPVPTTLNGEALWIGNNVKREKICHKVSINIIGYELILIFYSIFHVMWPKCKNFQRSVSSVTYMNTIWILHIPACATSHGAINDESVKCDLAIPPAPPIYDLQHSNPLFPLLPAPPSQRDMSISATTKIEERKHTSSSSPFSG